MAPVAAMIVVQAIVGIGQVVGQSSLGLSWLGEYHLSPNLGVSVITASDGTRFLRAYGLADHPNMLAGVLAMGLILLGGALATRPTVGPSWRLVAFVLGIATLLLTFSRGAWFALVIGLIVMAGMLALQRDRVSLRRLAIACGAGLIVGAPFIAPYADALDARTDGSGAIGDGSTLGRRTRRGVRGDHQDRRREPGARRGHRHAAARVDASAIPRSSTRTSPRASSCSMSPPRPGSSEAPRIS